MNNESRNNRKAGIENQEGYSEVENLKAESGSREGQWQSDKNDRTQQDRQDSAKKSGNQDEKGPGKGVDKNKENENEKDINM